MHRTWHLFPVLEGACPPKRLDKVRVVVLWELEPPASPEVVKFWHARDFGLQLPELPVCITSDKELWEL